MRTIISRILRSWVTFAVLVGITGGAALNMQWAAGLQPAAGQPTPPRLVCALERNLAVMVEVNTLREVVVQKAVVGISEWGAYSAVKAIIVITTPGRETLFETLIPVCAKAGLRLIPGIKTDRVLPPIAIAGDTRTYRQFDDVAGWARIADSVSLAAHYAESPVVVLENESAVIGHTKGHVEIDPATLARALRQLPQGITIVWYPTITSGRADRQVRQSIVLRVLLAEHPDVQFVDNSIDRPRAYAGVYAQRNYARLVALNDRPLYRLLYCYGPQKPYWMDEAIVPLIVGATAPPDCVVLYPGATRFAKAADKIGPLLDMAFGSND